MFKLAKTRGKTRAQKKAAEELQQSRFSCLNESEDEKENLSRKLVDQEAVNLDLITRLTKMELERSQMMKMLETMALRKINSNEPPIFSFSEKNVSPIVEAASAPTSLLAATAKVLQDNNLVEKNVPFLEGVDEDSFRTFCPKFELYRTKGGKKLLREMIAANTITYYQIQIEDDIMSMECNILYNYLKKINKLILDPMSILRTNLKMEKSSNYDKKKVQAYISTFLTLM